MYKNPDSKTPLKFVIRNLSIYDDPAHIKAELESLEYPVINVSQLHKYDQTKSSLPLFLITLHDTEKRREFCQLNSLNHSKIKI